jgi:hydroxyacylglutathione hydrolase
LAQLQVAIVPVTNFQQNCAIIWDVDTMQAAVFDPGGNVDRIMSMVRKLKVNVETIFLTHGHIDHAGGAMDLKDVLNVPIVGPHKDDEKLLSGIEEQAKTFEVATPVRNAVPDQWLEEGDTVSIGGNQFQIFHCPGHAPGHVVFFCEESQFAHVGDVLFAGGIGRTDLPGGNHQDLISSIKDKLLPLGDDIMFICGHGPDSTFGHERESNPFLVQ